VVILGEEEMRREAAVVKDMGTGAQEGVPVGNLVEYLVKS
jgi:histidyl-tRNA synthetase